MLSSVEVRIATVDDAGAVPAVHVRTWQDAYRGLLPDAHLDGLSVERRSEVWGRILSESDLPRTGTFLLEEGLDVIGFIHIAPTRDDNLPASTGEVTGIYITPSAWRLGGGRQLTDTAKASLEAAGFATAAIWRPAHSTNDRAGCRTAPARSTIEATSCSSRSAIARLFSCRWTGGGPVPAFWA